MNLCSMVDILGHPQSSDRKNKQTLLFIQNVVIPLAERHETKTSQKEKKKRHQKQAS